jgi:hypothetical protein
MSFAIWMHPWDLEHREPAAVLDHLLAHGIEEAYLAVRYHAGRMYLPTHPTRRVLDHAPGGDYLELFGHQIELFLNAASSRNFPVHAWMVLAHRDDLAAHQRHLCLENAWGDRYPYALCPSQPEVQDQFLAECRRVDQFHSWASLQLEALGFMGYSHNSEHDKRGVPLSADDEFRLSICFCPACMYGYGAHGDMLREAVLRGEQHASVSTMLLWRRSVQYGLLRQISEVVQAPLDIRTAASTRFTGGKSTLTFEECAGLAKACTVTFFGSSLTAMEAEVDRLAALPRPVAVNAGMIFHGPDCPNQATFLDRLALIRKPMFAKQILYCSALAGNEHWAWLRR